MFKSARSIAITVLLLGALAASGCGSSSGSSSSQSSASAAGGSASTNLHVVKVALVPIEDAMAVMLGDKKGIFAKHGVRIQCTSRRPQLEPVRCPSCSTARPMSDWGHSRPS